MAEHDGVHGALLDEWTVEVPLALLNPVRWKGSTARMASSLEGSLRDGSGLVAQPGSVLLSENKRWRPPRIQLRWADLRGHTKYGFKKVTCRLVSIDGGGSDDDDEEARLAAAEAAAATRAAAAQRRASSGRVRRRLMAAARQPREEEVADSSGESEAEEDPEIDVTDGDPLSESNSLW